MKKSFITSSPDFVVSITQWLILQGAQRRMVLVVIFFNFLSFFCLVVAIFDVEHDVEANHDLC